MAVDDLGSLLAGLPVRVESCNIAFTQPTIREICAFGEERFFSSVMLLTNIQRVLGTALEDVSKLAEIPDFQMLVLVMDQDPDLKRSIDDFLAFILPEYEYELGGAIMRWRLRECDRQFVGQVDPLTFPDFQQALSSAFIPADAREAEDYRPANDLAAEIAAKLHKGNEIRAQIAKDDGPKSLCAHYVSVLGIGVPLSVRTLYDYTLFQLYDAYDRYIAKMRYDMWYRIATMPMMDSSKMEEPEHWMFDLYKEKRR